MLLTARASAQLPASDQQISAAVAMIYRRWLSIGLVRVLFGRYERRVRVIVAQPGGIWRELSRVCVRGVVIS